jgi:hypothetical protein
MGAVTTPLIDRAESIFTDLGYAVSTDGGELRAERKWRTVRVTPVSDPSTIPETGGYRCFVTPTDRVDAVEGELRARDPDYEWAIIGVAEDTYEVSRGT